MKLEIDIWKENQHETRSTFYTFLYFTVCSPAFKPCQKASVTTTFAPQLAQQPAVSVGQGNIKPPSVMNTTTITKMSIQIYK